MPHMHPTTAAALALTALRRTVAPGQAITLHARGWRVNGKLEITVWYGDLWLAMFTDEPGAALAALVLFVRTIRAAGIPARVALRVNPAPDLPF